MIKQIHREIEGIANRVLLQNKDITRLIIINPENITESKEVVWFNGMDGVTANNIQGCLVKFVERREIFVGNRIATNSMIYQYLEIKNSTKGTKHYLVSIPLEEAFVKYQGENSR